MAVIQTPIYLMLILGHRKGKNCNPVILMMYTLCCCCFKTMYRTDIANCSATTGAGPPGGDAPVAAQTPYRYGVFLACKNKSATISCSYT